MQPADRAREVLDALRKVRPDAAVDGRGQRVGGDPVAPNVGPERVGGQRVWGRLQKGIRLGRLVGYSVCWTVGDQAELGNVAVSLSVVE